MYSTSTRRPATLFVLLTLLLVLGGGGFTGGVAMLMNPSGQPLGLSLALLDPVPVDSFLLPGLFLLILFGAVPLMVAFGVWALPEWRLLQRLNPWPEYHWSWAWTRAVGVVLIAWIVLEFLLWGNASPLQPLLLGVGLAILIMSGYPSVRRYMHMIGRPETVQEGQPGEDGSNDRRIVGPS